MSTCRLSVVAATLLVFAAAGSARAELVAGWDFSQYFGDGLLSIDGATYTDVLAANYSSLDPTNNAGLESAAFGTMYLNGQFGSTAVSAGSGSEQVLPSAAVGSLLSNLDAPVQQFGDNPFDSYEILVSEGQMFAVPLALTALADASVVFEADRGTPPPGGDHWLLSFAGRTQLGAATVTIDFSAAGSGYAPGGSVQLDTTDKAYTVDLGPAAGPAAFVRFNFTSASTTAPVIDNVAISVPEPGAAAGLVAAASALALCARRRS